ncbi:MAG: FAD:protein FMN transferase [Angelakisella sp.]
MIVRRIFALITALLLGLTAGCDRLGAPKYQKYSTQFMGAFDTVFQLVGYAVSQTEFQRQADYTQQRFTQLSHQFDRFYEYEGVNSIKTVNDNAGIAPVAVAPVVLDLVDLCRDWYDKTDCQTDISMGAVLSVWHTYMATYRGEENGTLPTDSELEAAAALHGMEHIVTDRGAGTLYLDKAGLELDLGAAAKGYAAELVANELVERGFSSFLISAGGNVVSRQPPLDGVRGSWGVGIQDPFADPNDPSAASLDVVFVTGEAVVTSGDYQRFYMADGQRIHHIIDPDTHLPANYYRGLTVVHQNSGIADILSTALFCMDYPTGRAFADQHQLKVYWVFPDGSVNYTDALKPQLKNAGGASGALQK